MAHRFNYPPNFRIISGGQTGADAAALDFAAVMATASRVFAGFEAQRPGLAARMRAAAVSAWRWAQAHPAEVYRQPADVKTGDYGDSHLADEFAWAAAELYITTGDDAYYRALNPAQVPNGVPSILDSARRITVPSS